MSISKINWIKADSDNIDQLPAGVFMSKVHAKRAEKNFQELTTEGEIQLSISDMVEVNQLLYLASQRGIAYNFFSSVGTDFRIHVIKPHVIDPKPGLWRVSQVFHPSYGDEIVGNISLTGFWTGTELQDNQGIPMALVGSGHTKTVKATYFHEFLSEKRPEGWDTLPDFDTTEEDPEYAKLVNEIFNEPMP